MTESILYIYKVWYWKIVCWIYLIFPTRLKVFAEFWWKWPPTPAGFGQVRKPLPALLVKSWLHLPHSTTTLGLISEPPLNKYYMFETYMGEMLCVRRSLLWSDTAKSLTALLFLSISRLFLCQYIHLHIPWPMIMCHLKTIIFSHLHWKYNDNHSFTLIYIDSTLTITHTLWPRSVRSKNNIHTI